ncbi:hypothetical protein TNCV_45461 [Trichonephila clavipes]|nr:hypothetical protein TNCV_45461 [Trichonephila clavipes]
MALRFHGGRDSLVVKVTDLWLVCHDFESEPLKTRRVEELAYFKSVEVQTFSRDAVGEVRRGGASSSVVLLFNHGSKLRGPSPKALE